MHDRLQHQVARKFDFSWVSFDHSQNRTNVANLPGTRGKRSEDKIFDRHKERESFLLQRNLEDKTFRDASYGSS